jgi:hypothetical protein
MAGNLDSRNDAAETNLLILQKELAESKS